MIFLQLLAPMLPLIVFIIIDAIFRNIRISIIAAIVCAAVQGAFFYATTGRFDWFILLDVSLIVGLGVIAILFKNELFFKVKPAIIEAAAIVFFLVMIMLPDRVLLDYFGRMLPKGMVFLPQAVGTLKTMLFWMCVYTLAHIAAVVYTARHCSRRTWAIVSGPGFYFIFIPMMIAIMGRDLKKRKKR
ncbi:MAG: septation protein IspZ [Chitinispirillaceae bacterium]|nr:septation protein IspZ [Chitinispirillaceae bacterium]